jgi:hypothetical protein
VELRRGGGSATRICDVGGKRGGSSRIDANVIESIHLSLS